MTSSRSRYPRARIRLVAETTRAYLGVTIEARADDRLVALEAEEFDAGIRLGELIREDMVAARLSPPLGAVVVGSPEYLGKRGIPGTLAELARHDLIACRQTTRGDVRRWELKDGDREIRIDPRGPAIVSDAVHAIDLAEAGAGLAHTFDIAVRERPERGRLVEVLADHALDEPGPFLYFPCRVATTPKLRALIDVARKTSLC